MSQPMLARCRAVVQNANAAHLLYRINFWMPKAKIRHRGLTWIANSARQWCEETGLTVDQYRRSIAVLRRRQFVETEQHLFAGKNVTHVRLTELAVALLELNKSALPESGTSAMPGPRESAQLNMQGDSALKNHHEGTTMAFADAHANGIRDQKILPGKKSGGQEELSSKKKSDFEVQPPQSSPQPGMKGSGEGCDDDPTALAACWKHLVTKEYAIYVPTVTKKQLGQFKVFRDACPLGMAHAVLEVCLKDWSGFCLNAKHDYAAFGIPGKPTLEFLLKYIVAAINFALAELESQSANAPTWMASEPSTKVAVPFPKVGAQPLFSATHSTEHEKKLTKEEMLAILDDD